MPRFSYCIALALALTPSLPLLAHDDGQLVHLRRRQDLRFGAFAVEGGGSIRLDAETGQRQVLGELTPLSDHYAPAEYELTGPPGRMVQLLYPTRAALHGLGAGGRVTLIDPVLVSPGPMVRLGPDGKARVHVGGELQIRPDSPNVDYHGTFDLRVRAVE